MWQRTFVQYKRQYEAESYCSGLDYGGYSDWRLPYRFELQSIVDYGRKRPAIDIGVFPGTPVSLFWTNTPDTLSPTQYDLIVDFSYGTVYRNYSASNASARCVRGMPKVISIWSYDRFVVSNHAGDNVIFDPVTDLTWQEEYFSSLTWAEALAYCEDLDYGGRQDWRLPNIQELSSLVNTSKRETAYDFPDIVVPEGVFYWSSTTYLRYTSQAFVMYFSDGNISSMIPKTAQLMARCVCDGHRPPAIDGDMDGDMDFDLEDDIVDEEQFFPDDYCTFNHCLPVIPTNQTACYNNDSAISCPGEAGTVTCGSVDFCGQDAQYPDNSRRYTCYNADGTTQNPCLGMAYMHEVVTDSLTGLMWQRIFAEEMPWQKAMDYCDSLDYAGYSDWRLPNRFELQSLVDYGRSDPAIDISAFPLWPLTSFWSSSTGAYPNSYWYVHFQRGSVELAFTGSINTSKYARCVRSGM